MNKNFVHLSISSFMGLSPEATHYYGTLSSYDGKEIISHEILRKMDREDVRLFNKNNWGAVYRVGELTRRFTTEQGIIRIAKKIWRKHFPSSKVLILGRGAVCEPQLIIDIASESLEWFKRKNNILYKRAEKCNCWDNESKMLKICKEWDKLCEKLT